MDDNKQDVSVEQGIINSVQHTQADVKTFAKENEMRLYQMAGAMSRSLLAGRLGTQFSGERDLYASFGYVLNPQYRDYRNLFDRQGLASRAVTKFADDTWNKPPIITDGDSRSDTLDEKATPFLKEWAKLSKRLRVYSVFRRADIMLGFSKYSVIFLGLPGAKYADPAGKSKGLYFLRAFDESQATISSWIKNNKLAEYGMPESYTVSFADEAGGMVEVQGGNLVHYTRVIHVAEDKLSSIIYGTPRLQKVINRLFDLEKTTGGGAEAAWLAVFKGILFLAREGAELPREGTQEYNDLNSVINAFMHRQQRYATLSDVDVKDLGVSEVNVKSIFEVLIADLCGSLGIPQRILLGSERGELASSQDKMEWNSLINSRRTNFAEPDILRPFIDKCVTLGILPAPVSGDEYGIIWPDVYPMTKTEKADYALKLAQGASSVTGGNPEDALDINEFRNEVDLPPRTEKQLNDFQDEHDQRAQEMIDQKPVATTGKEKADTQDRRKQVANLNEKSGPFTRLIRRFFPNSFPDHKGRPGQVGGSLPRSAGEGNVDESKVIKRINKTFEGTHISSNLESLESGFENRRLGISIARNESEELSSPTLDEPKGTKGRVLVKVSGDGLDYNDPKHREFIDLVSTQVEPPYDVNTISYLRSQGIDFVDNWDGLGKADELHVLNADAIEILEIEKFANTNSADGDGIDEPDPSDDVNQNSFPGHKGRPGQRGGSLPRGAGSGENKYIEERTGTLLDQLSRGGFSVSIDGISPKSGYMTARSNKTELKINVKDVNADIIANYAVENAGLLAQDDAYLGGWLDLDKESGETYAYLDVSYNYQNLNETITEAAKSKQIGVFDVVNKRTLYIDYDSGNAPFYWKDEEIKDTKIYV